MENFISYNIIYRNIWLGKTFLNLCYSKDVVYSANMWSIRSRVFDRVYDEIC